MEDIVHETRVNKVILHFEYIQNWISIVIF